MRMFHTFVAYVSSWVSLLFQAYPHMTLTSGRPGLYEGKV